eukprot:6205006-Pleurochrysis_carterae.AAC.1
MPLAAVLPAQTSCPQALDTLIEDRHGRRNALAETHRCRASSLRRPHAAQSSKYCHQPYWLHSPMPMLARALVTKTVTEEVTAARTHQLSRLRCFPYCFGIAQLLPIAHLALLLALVLPIPVGCRQQLQKEPAEAGAVVHHALD